VTAEAVIWITAGFVPELVKVKNGMLASPEVLVNPLTVEGIVVALHVIIAPGVADVMFTALVLDCEQIV